MAAYKLIRQQTSYENSESEATVVKSFPNENDARYYLMTEANPTKTTPPPSLLKLPLDDLVEFVLPGEETDFVEFTGGSGYKNYVIKQVKETQSDGHSPEVKPNRLQRFINFISRIIEKYGEMYWTPN